MDLINNLINIKYKEKQVKHYASAANQNPSAANQNPSAANQNPSAGNQNPSAANQNPSAGNQNFRSLGTYTKNFGFPYNDPIEILECIFQNISRENVIVFRISEQEAVLTKKNF